MRILTKSKRILKLSFASGAAVFMLALAALSVQAPHAFALCDNVNIIQCGLDDSTPIASMKSHYQNNNPGDFRKVANWGGWSGYVAGMDGGNTKVGTLHSRTGNVTVDGRVVGKDAKITARFTKGAGYTEISPGVWSRDVRLGTTAYDSYRVLVRFDASGKAVAGIVINCGNVIKFTPTPPPPPPAAVTKCTGMDTPVMLNRDPLSYSFTAHAKAENATFTGATFDFGDGKKAQGNVSGLNVTAEHKYAQGGSYTITATLQFTAYGDSRSDTCKTTLTINLPSYACTNVDGSILDKDKHSYRIVAHYVAENASFIDANFDFGDGNVMTAVKSKDGKTVSADHTYAKAGTYSIAITMRFTANGQTVTAPICKAVVTPTNPPVSECKPGIPQGDVRCNPCPYNPNLPAGDKNCIQAATTLPNTGAGNVIALSSAALVAGFLWYRHLLFKRHKAAYLAADFGTSPLPLAEPLESPDPLRDTPLEPKRRRISLRRRRQF